MSAIGIDLAAMDEERPSQLRRCASNGCTDWKCIFSSCTGRWSGLRRASVIIDPINNLVSVGEIREVKLMFMRIGRTTSNCAKQRRMLTSVTPVDLDESYLGLSSLMDTWLQLRAAERGEQRIHELFRREITRNGPLACDS
jgi:hypothetical protein